MNLGVLSEQGGSIGNLAASGQDRRFVDQYLRRYAASFEHVYYFSYADEAPRLPDGCSVVGNRWRLQRWVYAFAMPFLHARAFRGCAVLRVMQLTGEVPAILAKIAYGVPFVATYGYDYAAHARADGAGRLRAAAFRIRTRIALRFADRVIVTNPRIRAEVERAIGAGRVLYVPNAVDTEAFSPAPAPVAPGRPRIVFLGRLAPQKNLPQVIEAAARCGADVVLRFIGAGPMEPALRSQAAAAGVPLELPGVVPHEQLPAELRQATVFVLASSIEGHPKALIEAMSCGCACVGADVEGIREVIEHGRTGLLAPPTAEALALALRQLLEDAPLRARLGANARQYVMDHYEISVTLASEIAGMKKMAGERR